MTNLLKRISRNFVNKKLDIFWEISTKIWKMDINLPNLLSFWDSQFLVPLLNGNPPVSICKLPKLGSCLLWACSVPLQAIWLRVSFLDNFANGFQGIQVLMRKARLSWINIGHPQLEIHSLIHAIKMMKLNWQTVMNKWTTCDQKVSMN